MGAPANGLACARTLRALGCSLGYFKQRTIAGEVGSSTMPHKVGRGRLALLCGLPRLVRSWVL